MTEDKDLARADEIRRQIIGDYRDWGGIPDDTNKFIASKLKEERRRLLNDPRIKEILKQAESNHDKRCVPCDAKSFSYCKFIKAHNDFESLLKENES